MQTARPDVGRYDHTTIVLHWIVALLVAEQWIGAQMIDLFPRGPLRVDARSVHIVCGVLLAAALIIRVVWRATRGRRLPPADAGFLNVVAKATHWTLYLLLITMVLAGFSLAWARGDSLFNVVTIPAFDPNNKALPHELAEFHGAVAWVILAVACAHAGAALIHRFVWKDRVLQRMLLR